MKDEINIKPSETSSADDFDFLVGKWHVQNRKLKTRLNDCDDWTEFPAAVEMRKIINGLGNFETFTATFDAKPFEGMAVRLFNPQTRLWSIYWADSNNGVLDKHPVEGSFEGSLGKFYANDEFDGRPITVLYQWDKSDPQIPIWSQAFSTDNGATWEWNWYMTFTQDAAVGEAKR